MKLFRLMLVYHYIYSLLNDYICTMKTISNKTAHLPLIVEQDEDNIYIVSCPIFKGCHSYGKTIDEALDNIKEVIEICLEEEKGKKVRSSNRFIGYREMEVRMKKLSA